MSTYHVFRRKVWRKRIGGQFEPYNGRKRTVARGLSLEDARKLCAEHNPPPGERRPGHPMSCYEFEGE